MTAKSLTIRLPQDIYQESREIAQERHTSLNALIQDCLQATIDAWNRDKLYDAFTLVGSDEDADVSFAFDAQREVVMRDDS